MSKFEDIIARVDEIKPNAFSVDTKLNWLTSLNGKLAIDIFMMDIAEVRELPQGAAAIDCEPLVGFPHEEVYEEYLAAKIDAANGEASEYQNRMQIYDAYYTNFVGWFKATYDPVQGDPNCHGLKPKLPTYYITAYGLARMKGFTGTIEEWLASLKGDPGVSVTVTTVPIEGGHSVTFVDVTGEKSFDVMDGSGNVSSVCGVLADQTGNVPLTAEKLGARPDDWTPTAEDVGARPDDWTPSADDVKALPNSGGDMTGPINMNGQALRGLNAPTADDQAVNKKYLDDTVKDAKYSSVLNLSTAENTISADMLGKTLMCRVSGNFVLTISKEVHDTLPIGFEFALVYWDDAQSVKISFTGGIYACIAGEGSIENATIALPERFTMIAAKKTTSESWLVTGNVEVV